MSLSKHQLAGKPSKKTLPLDDKVKFLDFDKGNPECRKLNRKYKQKYLKSEKLLLQTFLKKRSLFVASILFFSCAGTKVPQRRKSQHELFREKSKKYNRSGKY